MNKGEWTLCGCIVNKGEWTLCGCIVNKGENGHYVDVL